MLVCVDGVVVRECLRKVVCTSTILLPSSPTESVSARKVTVLARSYRFFTVHKSPNGTHIDFQFLHVNVEDKMAKLSSGRRQAQVQWEMRRKILNSPPSALPYQKYRYKDRTCITPQSLISAGCRKVIRAPHLRELGWQLHLQQRAQGRTSTTVCPQLLTGHCLGVLALHRGRPSPWNLGG